jgi:hypothetical protein
MCCLSSLYFVFVYLCICGDFIIGICAVTSALTTESLNKIIIIIIIISPLLLLRSNSSIYPHTDMTASLVITGALTKKKKKTMRRNY